MNIISAKMSTQKQKHRLKRRHCYTLTQGWTLAPARLPMAGNFHEGQVKFDKYQPGWQALFSKSQADHCLWAGKNVGLVTFQSYQPDWLVPEKVKIQPCCYTTIHSMNNFLKNMMTSTANKITISVELNLVKLYINILSLSIVYSITKY